MIKKILSVITLFISFTLVAQEVPLIQGMRINKSTKIKKDNYKLHPVTDSLAVIIIEGDNITVDFNQAILQSGAPVNEPDRFSGLAILVRKGKNITIKNAIARGYKVALKAENIQGLTIQNCDFSYNYRPRLLSTQLKENIADWMSYHHNEKDEWLRYGAAMYLKNCDLAIIRDNKVTGGQNALMMTGSDDGLIYNNDFSFNSGIGIGMYRSERNKVMYNRVIFNVRGYSHGVYNRGQDSAGILVYEQSNQNLFYKNAVTHGGDGFFLWAGQTTMDSGTGGCNDNVLLENDFSYAPTNGIEVTFSRNIIRDNRIYECDHGIWGGYSYNTKINNNKFRNNRVAVAIEHGQENMIAYNTFYKNREAIRLWSREQQPADWGYAKYRDTKSRDYIIASNSFNSDSLIYNLKGTNGLNLFNNTYSGIKEVFKTDASVKNLDSNFYEHLYQASIKDSNIIIPELENPMNPFAGNGEFAGRVNIRMLEWGPYDFRSPVIWHTNPTDTGRLMKFDILGPAGKWKIKSAIGVTGLSSTQGTLPASISASRVPGPGKDIRIEVEYVGQAIVSPYGVPVAAGKPYIFSYKNYFKPIDWQVKWFSYDSTEHPLNTENPLILHNKTEVKAEKTDRLEYAWWGGIRSGDKQYPQFITIAEGELLASKGDYEMGITWDDAVRVYFDDQLILDEWNPARYTFDQAPHKKIKVALNGKHKLRVEHVEKGGFATLSFQLKPADY